MDRPVMEVRTKGILSQRIRRQLSRTESAAYYGPAYGTDCPHYVQDCEPRRSVPQRHWVPDYYDCERD